MSHPTVVIAGGGLAGATTAVELRERGFDGRILLVGAERERPYERPPLTKDYLRGESEREQAHVHPADFYAQQEIELVTGATVTAVEPGPKITVGVAAYWLRNRVSAAPWRPLISGSRPVISL